MSRGLGLREIGGSFKHISRELPSSKNAEKIRSISYSTEQERKSRQIDVEDKYIKWFSELSNKDIAIAGGKGASLGEMFNNKFPVPPGFVITAQAFDYFMIQKNLKEKIKEIIEIVDLEDTGSLQQASKQVRDLIEKEEIPKELEIEILEAYHILGSEEIEEKGVSRDALNILKTAQEPIFVSVRSSATTEDLVEASFAGQQESFLNIKGERRLIEHVKKCFSSLYTPRAIYYRNKQGFKEGQALLAVVIQKMVDSEKSGVVFSRDPIKLDEDIIIEAVFGLGEGIVAGKIHPDHYTVSRDLEIKEVNVTNKKIAIVRTGSGENQTVNLSPEKSKSQVLKNYETKEIADYAIQLENHYKKPQDIEFAIEAGKVYIVQSRPITTLKKDTQKSGKIINGTVILKGLSASPGIGAGVVKLIKGMEDLYKIKKGDVLVTEMTNPDMVVAMQKSVAIVTDEGGMTSHAAIVSREMGIPAIVGTGEATTVLKEGMKVTVDGSTGNVYEGLVAETQQTEIKPILQTEKIKMKVIVDLPNFAERAAKSGIDAVGLVRLEGIIASSGKHPLQHEKDNTLNEYTELLRAGLEKISEPFNSIWIRASDIRTDEYGSLKGAPEREINPMLGNHGIRFSLKHPKILEAELEAIRLIAEKNPNKRFGIMFPQVISIEEVKKAKEYFNKIKTENMEFGAMIETPAAVQIIEDICQEVDFISFGTNDLTQFTLGVDRGEDEVQELYNEMHPAIFSQIKRVIGSCRRNRVETSICGQAGSKPEMVEFLFKKGINSISVNADAAYNISVLINKLEEEQEKIKEEKMQERVQKNEQTNNMQPVKINQMPKIFPQDMKRFDRRRFNKLKKKYQNQIHGEINRESKIQESIPSQIQEAVPKQQEQILEQIPTSQPGFTIKQVSEQFLEPKEQIQGQQNQNNINPMNNKYDKANNDVQSNNEEQFSQISQTENHREIPLSENSFLNKEKVEFTAEEDDNLQEHNIKELKTNEIDNHPKGDLELEDIKKKIQDEGKSTDSNSLKSEDIGIYNSNEEESKPKQTYNYNFDDDY